MDARFVREPEFPRPKSKLGNPKVILLFALTVGGLFIIGSLANDSTKLVPETRINPYVSAPQPTVEPVASPMSSEPVVHPTWGYSSREDDMGKGSVKFAMVESSNEVSFGFPYQGAQRATLELRKHPRHGKDIILSIQKGQFIAGYSGTSLLVRFDDGAAQKFYAVEPADHSSNMLFIQGYEKFVARAKRSSKIRIEATFYHEGNRTFEFNSSGLEF
jgi:hypothetical protein